MDSFEETTFTKDVPPKYEDIDTKTGQATVKESRNPNRRLFLYIAAIATVTAVIAAVLLAVILTSNDGSPSTTTTSPPPVSMTSTSSTVSPTTEPTTVPLGWGSWSAWSSCDKSCDGGYQERTRECVGNSDVCVGGDHQVQECNEERCSDPDYGEWSHWSPWSTCTLSCDTGTQSRTRTCNMEEDDLQCPGNLTESRDCNTTPCPDCGDPCPGGGIAEAPDCLRCVCQTNITGIVRDDSNIPIDDVSISDSWSPLVTLTTSDINGNFIVIGGCIGTTIVASKSGYVTKYHDATNADITVTIVAVDLLKITVNPSNKVRLAGDSATLCCNATGIPVADFYEWFYHGAVIQKEKQGQLTLPNLKTNHSGYYKCRASNDFSSIYSEEAFLQVEESPVATCHPTPLSNIITLDEECVFEGGNKIDVGTCSRVACRSATESDNGFCEDNSTYCCTPLAYDTYDITCADGLYIEKVFIVKECGCAICPTDPLHIMGQAYAADDNSPLVMGTILVNDNPIAYTDFSGYFDFTLEHRGGRLVVTFRDTNSGRLADAIRVLNVARSTIPGQPRLFYLSVSLIRFQPEQTYDSSQPLVLSLQATNQNTSFGTVHIGANSFYTSDGVLYTGQVKTKVAVADPRNINDIKSAPGDFSFVDELGNVRPLKTFGMFYMSFKNDDGDTLTPRNFDTAVAMDENRTEENIQLWSLDFYTGNWKDMGALESGDYAKNWKNVQEKVKFLSTKIFSNRGLYYYMNGIKWYNYDDLHGKGCHVKIRVFRDNSSSSSMVPYASGLPEVYIRSGSGYYGYRVLASDDPKHPGVFCMLIECEMGSTEVIGFIVVPCSNGYCFPAQTNEYSNQYSAFLANSKHNIKNTFEMHTKMAYRMAMDMDVGGFFYTGTGSKQTTSPTCVAASPNAGHYWFYKDKFVPTVCEEVEKVAKNVDCASNNPEYSAENILRNWYPNTYPGTPYKIPCYLKVKIEGSTTGKVFDAKSLVGTYDTPSLGITPGMLYDDVEVCPGNNDFVCLEFKSSGSWFYGCGAYTDSTKVVIRNTGLPTCAYNSTSQHLTDDMVTFLGEISEGFEVLVLTNKDGGSQNNLPPETGIYCHVGTPGDYTKSREHALKRCLTGSRDIITGDITESQYNSTNSAFSVNCT